MKLNRTKNPKNKLMMKKEIRHFILVTLMKMMVFIVCAHFYCEYIISKDFPGILQLAATLFMIAIMIVIADSVINSINKLRNKN